MPTEPETPLPEPAQFLVAHSASLPPLVPVGTGRWVNPTKLVAVVPRRDPESGVLVPGGCVILCDDGVVIDGEQPADQVAAAIRDDVAAW